MLWDKKNFKIFLKERSMILEEVLFLSQAALLYNLITQRVALPGSSLELQNLNPVLLLLNVQITKFHSWFLCK